MVMEINTKFMICSLNNNSRARFEQTGQSFNMYSSWYIPWWMCWGGLDCDSSSSTHPRTFPASL